MRVGVAVGYCGCYGIADIRVADVVGCVGCVGCVCWLSYGVSMIGVCLLVFRMSLRLFALLR